MAARRRDAAGGRRALRGVPDPRRGGQGHQRGVLSPPSGRDAGHPRRVRVGQVGHRAGDHGDPRHPARLRHRRRGALLRHRHPHAARRASPGDPRAGDLDGLPGRAVLAEPGVPGGLADRGDVPQAPRHEQVRLAGAGRQADGAGADPGRPAAGQGLPAPVLRRDAAADHDRDGDRPGSGRTDRRRADHCARRHRAGPDHEAAEGPAGRAEDGADPDHPRPRRGGRRGRPDRGDVRGADRGAGGRLRSVRPARAPVHQGSAGLHSPAGPEGRDAGGDRRAAAQPDADPARLSLQPAVLLRAGHLPGRSTAPVARGGTAPVRGLPLLRAAAHPQPRAGGDPDPRCR